MKSRTSVPIRVGLLLAGTFAVVGGHHHLDLFLATHLFRPDLPSTAALATLSSSVFVQLAIAAFWLPMALASRRLGLPASTVRLCLWTAVASMLLRATAEASTGMLVADYPAVAIAAAIVATSVLADRSAWGRACRRSRDSGIAVLPRTAAVHAASLRRSHGGRESA